MLSCMNIVTPCSRFVVVYWSCVGILTITRMHWVDWVEQAASRHPEKTLTVMHCICTVRQDTSCNAQLSLYCWHVVPYLHGTCVDIFNICKCQFKCWPEAVACWPKVVNIFLSLKLLYVVICHSLKSSTEWKLCSTLCHACRLCKGWLRVITSVTCADSAKADWEW